VTGSPAFISRLCDADLAALTKRWHERSYRHNELIISHGDTGREVYFLLEGRARVTLVSADGREIAYRDVEPGDIFGELGGIDGIARSASVVALEATRAARLSGTAFRDIVMTHPTFAWMLLEHLSAQLRRMNRAGIRIQHSGRAKTADRRAPASGGESRTRGRRGVHKPGTDAFRAGGNDEHAQGSGLARNERPRQERPDRKARQQVIAA
jgi:CRP-like cAMP-binding protein